MTCKTTIITPAFNSAATIKDTIQSVLEQDYNNIEYIIVDGGSNDGTGEIINRHIDRISIFISEPDNGIYHAMNKGIARATGDIIALLNSDDCFANNSVVSTMVNYMEKNELDAAYADLEYFKSDNPDRVTRKWKPGEYVKGSFRLGWVPPHPTFFCRKIIYQQYGDYLETFKIAADFELMLRLMEKYNIKTGYLPEVTVKMRTGGKANRIRGILKGNMEILKAFRLNRISVSPLFFCVKPAAKLKQLFNRQ